LSGAVMARVSRGGRCRARTAAPLAGLDAKELPRHLLADTAGLPRTKTCGSRDLAVVEDHGPLGARRAHGQEVELRQLLAEGVRSRRRDM